MCMREGHQCKGGKKKYIYIHEIFFLIYFIFKLYIIVLVLPHMKMNLDKGNQRDNSGQIKVSFILPFRICILF